MSGETRYNVIYTKLSLRDLRSFTPVIQKRLGVKIEFFMSHEDPLAFARALTEPADAQYRFRVGDYRILFDVEDDTIVIHKIQHRRDAYKKHK